MNKIINNSSIEIISLGATCAVKLFINEYGEIGTTKFFDWIGNMVGMLPEIIQPSPITFENSFYPENSECAKIYSWKNDTRVHKKYFLSFPHYNENKYDNDRLTLMLNTRMKRFYDKVLYNTEKFKIFIYFEDNDSRFFNHKYNEYVVNKCVCSTKDIDKYVYKQTIFQVEIIKKLSNSMVEMFPCKFLIIYLSNYLSKDFDYEDRVISIKTDDIHSAENCKNWASIINNSLNRHTDKILNLVESFS